MQKTYSYRNVFYKTDESDGWHSAILSGNDDEVKKKCLSHKDWIDYDIRCGGVSSTKIKDSLRYYPCPDTVHQLTYWVYAQELDKWFIKEDEVIPYPEKECEQSDDIDFAYSFDESECNLNDIEDFDNEDEVYISADINITTPTQKTKCVAEITALYDSFEKFIKNLKKNKFAVLHIEEFSYDKFIAWEKDDYIRFTVHDYSSGSEKEYIQISLDVLVDKYIFYDKFEKFYHNMKKESKNLKNKIIEIVKQRNS